MEVENAKCFTPLKEEKGKKRKKGASLLEMIFMWVFDFIRLETKPPRGAELDFWCC
jgi:hypothetical protein